MKQLLKKIAHGDEDAANEFFSQNFKPLYRFVYYRSGRNRELAEDIVQEVFMKVVDHAGDFRSESQPFTWLCQMAKNRLTDHWRRQATQQKWWKSVTIADSQYDQHSSLQSIEEAIQERNDLIHLSLSALDPLFQKVLEGKYFRGLSLKLIGQEIKRSEKAVESLLYRARQAFKAHYEILLKGMNRA